MARAHHHPNRHALLLWAVLAFSVGTSAVGVGIVSTSVSGASVITPMSASWCTVHGSSVGAWAPTTPALPICGPGPSYGGTWRYVNIPGPFGGLDTYFNATPGFQCVELAERYLSVVDGLAPVKANGATVAMNYHAAYPDTSLVVNGTIGAIGHVPEPGDVISLSGSSGFVGTDGHVAIVVRTLVDGAGAGQITIAQQNVAAADYIYTLDVYNWRLFDPAEPTNALFQYPYAEWLSVPPVRSISDMSARISLVSNPSASSTATLLLVPHETHMAASSTRHR